MRADEIETAALELLRTLALNVESLDGARELGFDFADNATDDDERAIIAEARAVIDREIQKREDRGDRRLRWNRTTF